MVPAIAANTIATESFVLMATSPLLGTDEVADA
jgi:hypothetical protein